MKWEKLPNGKYKPLKEFKVSSNGKYDPADPVYKARAKRKMQKVILDCDKCGKSTLYEPCVHHLGDGYVNDMKKKQYKKIQTESQSIEVSKY
jgi:hypothetical protein